MPRALPPAVRKAIWNRFQAGKHPSDIAEEFQVSERTIRRLIVDVDLYGDAAFHASYDACGLRQSKENAKIRKQTLKLRQKHPKWGAGRMLLELGNLLPNCELPCERTLERWLRHEQIPPAPAGRPGQAAKSRADEPHKVWQVDAAEQKRLANGKMISWLRVADECSGAVLKTIVFSRRPFHASAAAKGAKAFEVYFYRARVARGTPRRQWCSLGVVERLATGARLVGNRAGCGNALERSQTTAAEWSHRTDARLGQNVGRTGSMPNRQTVPVSHQPRRSTATRAVSRHRWLATHGGIPSTETFGPPIQQNLGTTALGLGCRTDSSGWIRRAAAS